MRFKSCLMLFFASFLSISAYALPMMKHNLPTVTLVTAQWKPYVQDESRYYGYAYEMVKAAFAEAGYNVKIEFLSWHDAQERIRDGKADGIFPAYYAKKRKRHLAYSKPFTGGPIGLYHLRNKRIYGARPRHRQRDLFNHLARYKFGAVRDYVTVSAFDNNRRLKKRYVKSDKENLEQLLKRKVDLVIMDKFVAAYLLHHQFPKGTARKVQFIEPPLANKNLYLAVPKTNPNRRKILAAFNHGMLQIRKNGVMSHILDKDAKRMGIQVV